MQHPFFLSHIAVTFLCVLLLSGCSTSNQHSTGESVPMGGPLVSVQDSSSAMTALRLALEEEYKALSYYRIARETFGVRGRPFPVIERSQERITTRLAALLQRFDVEPVRTDWHHVFTVPKTLEEACTEALVIEATSVAVYTKEFVPQSVQNTLIQNALKQALLASKENHMPAFRRCIERQSL